MRRDGGGRRGRAVVLWAAGCVLSVGAASPAQGTRADYQRAAELRALTRGKVFRDRIEPTWSPDGNRLWYRVQTGPDRHEFVYVDIPSRTRRAAFDHARLAAALAAAGVRGARPEALPVSQVRFDRAGGVVFRCGGKWWRFDPRGGKVRRAADVAGTGRAETLRPPAAVPKASRPGGPETSVAFLNATDAPVGLIWLDTRGKRHDYGRVAPGARRDQHTYAGHVWLVLDAAGRPLGGFQARSAPALVEITTRPAPARPKDKPHPKPKASPAGSRSSARSPDGRWTAFLREYNVHLRDARDGKEYPLSTDGSAEDRYDGRFYWSPDSTRLVVPRTRPAQEHKVYVVESSPRDQVQPKLHSWNYLKPGDRIAVTKPHLFDVAAKKLIPLSDALFPNPWSVRDIRWEADSSRFTFVYNQRGHQVLRVLAADAKNGSVRAIVDERSRTFIHYSGKYFLRWLDETGELIWMSERDGWNHLYLYDARSGRVKNQVTKGRWVVRGVDRVDVEKRQVWFRAGGIRPGQDPYYIHYARVGFDGSGLVVLTAGDGTHEVQYSPDGRYFLDRYSRVDLPPVTELRRTADGELICTLERGDFRALLETGWKPPIRFVAKGRDGRTDIYGVIFRPVKFDPHKKYPVIESIYAGPHGSFVPKAFHAYYGQQALAELGFVVVRIDGMGTNNRSKAFHDVCWKNLADAGLPDRILWIKAAGEKYPWMDVTRVGIYGGSAGGQSAAAAVMTHGDFYKVAVADCGCHDNRMDKIWWNEQWMGWPVGPEYAANSNVTLAPGLKGKLLLIVGELDRNVDPASTMQVVNALIKADKDFDLLVVPGAGHGAAGTPYGRRRQADYFVRHLLGVEPRSR